MLNLQASIEQLLVQTQETELEQDVVKLAAQIYISLQEWEKGLAMLAQIDDREAEVFFLRGGCLIEKGDRIGANLSYNEGLDLYPDNPKLLQGYTGNLINIGQPELALKHIKTLIEIEPKEVIGYLLKVEILIGQKDYSQALSVLQLAEINCGEIGLTGENFKGSCYGQLGEDEKGCEAFARAVSYDEEFYPGWFNLALGLSRLGREEEADLALSRIPEWVVKEFLERTKTNAAKQEEAQETNSATN